MEELRAKTADITVTADIDRTSFTRAALAAGQLGGREDVTVSADVNTSSFARAKAATATLTKESQKMGDVFNRSNLSIGQWTGIIASAAPVILDTAGALTSLTASLGAATAGLGALTVGAGAAGGVGLAGIAAIGVPAVKTLKDLKTAQDAYTLAVQQYGKHSTQARTAFSKLQVEQKKAGPEAVKFAKNLRDIGRSFQSLTRAGRGDFFGTLNDGLRALDKRLPLLAKSANTSMHALRDGFDQFLKKATGPEFNGFIRTMTRTFAASMGPLADAFGNIAKVLERIAVAVAPDIVRAVRGFDEMTKGWVQSTKNAGQLRDTIHGLVNQANTWVKLIEQAAKLIVAVLVPGVGQGQKAVKELTGQLKEWTKWVDSHPAAVRDFFKEALKTTKLFAEVLVGFVPQIFEISTAMRPIARAFLGITKALNSIKVGNVTALTALLGAFVAASGIKKVAGAVSAFSGVGRGVKSLGGRVLGASGGPELVAAGGALDGSAAALSASAAELSAAAVGQGVGKGGGAAGALSPAAQRAMPGTRLAPTTAESAFPFAGMGAAFQGADVAATTSKLATFAKVAGGAALAVTVLAGAVEDMRTNFLGVRDIFSGFFQNALKPVIDAFAALGKELTTGPTGEAFHALGDIFQTIGPPLKFIVTNLTKLLGLGLLGFVGSLAAVFAATLIPIYALVKGITLLVKGFKGVIGAGKIVVKWLKDHWGAIGHVLGAPFRFLFGAAKDAFGFVKARAGDAVNFIKGHWKQLGAILISPFTGLGQFVADRISFVTGKIKSAVGFIRSHWGDIEHILAAPFKGIRDVVKSVIGFIVQRVKDAIHGIQRLIDKVNDIPHPSVSIHHVGPVPVPVPGFGGQHGGIVTSQGIVPLQGFQGGGIVGAKGLSSKDTVPTMLEVGELVIPKKMVDATKKNAKKVGISISGEVGKGYKTVIKDSKKFVKDHHGQIDKLRTNALATTKKFRKDTIDDFQNTSKQGTDLTNRMKGNVTDSMGRMKKGANDQSSAMKKGVTADFQSMDSAVSKAIKKLADMTNKALKALGVKPVQFGVAEGSSDSGGKGKQTGGMVVPGTGSGDKVPLRAMVEPGEKVFVLNRNASKVHSQLEDLNKKVPRFQQGGILDRTGVPHLAGGGYAGMQPEIVALVKTFLSKFGGSMSSGLRPGDPGFHGRGLAADIVPSDWTGASKYANSIGSQLLEGIHQGPPGVNVSWDSGQEVSPSFWGASTWAAHVSHIHVATSKAITGAVGGVAKMVKEVLLQGAKGPILDMGQAAVNKVRGAANKYIAAHQPSGVSGEFISGSGGSVVKQIGGVLLKAGLDRTAAAAVIGNAYAESTWNPTADDGAGNGGLWGFTTSPVSYNDLKAYAAKQGEPWESAVTQTNFLLQHFSPQHTGPSRSYMNKLNNEDLRTAVYDFEANWERPLNLGNPARLTGAQKALQIGFQQGGVVTPYVGKFHEGGIVPRDGMGLLKGGEAVVPGLKKGGSGFLTPFAELPGIKALINAIHLAAFGPKASRRLDYLKGKDHLSKDQKKELEVLKGRKAEHQLELKLLRQGGGPGAMARLLKAMKKYGPTFSASDKKREHVLGTIAKGLSKHQRKEIKYLKSLDNLSDKQRKELKHLKRIQGGLSKEQHKELMKLHHDQRRARREHQAEEMVANRRSVEKELLSEFKAWRKEEDKRHNELKEIAAASRLLRALSNSVGGQLGVQSRAKARNAATPGSAGSF